MDRVLEQFDAVSVVTTGTPGAVAWVAREPDSEDIVLIKRLPDDSLRSRATQALALNHPGIASTTKWLYDDSQFYVVRTYIEGESLRHAADNSRIPSFSSLKSRLDAVLYSLEALHGSGAAHGGITPENIIIDSQGSPVITDFATVSGAHGQFVPGTVLGKQATPKADYYALCEIYKEFLPVRPPDDEEGNAARERLIRNLTEVQQTCRTAAELRYKLDAVANMANILGFDAANGERDTLGPWHCARLVCSVTPSTATLSPGGVTAVVVSLENTGNIPLVIENIGSDVVWLNPVGKASRLTIAPDANVAMPFTLSGARLVPGDYTAQIIVRSNHEMSALQPPEGVPWHEYLAALPVMVQGLRGTVQPPLAERLSDVKEKSPQGTFPPDNPRTDQPPPQPVAPTEQQPQALNTASAGGKGTFSVRQNPDPVVIRQGEVGVLHVTATYNGNSRARIDRVSTWPPWLVYPGEFKPAVLSASSEAAIGFSVLSPTLTAGDYTAEVTLIASELVEHAVGSQTEWQEVKCPIRVRVLRQDAGSGPANPGCAPIILGFGLIGLIGASCAHLKL